MGSGSLFFFNLVEEEPMKQHKPFSSLEGHGISCKKKKGTVPIIKSLDSLRVSLVSRENFFFFSLTGK